MEIQLTIAKRDLANCEDGLIDVQGDVRHLRAAIRWLNFVQIIQFVFAAALAAGGKDFDLYCSVSGESCDVFQYDSRDHLRKETRSV